jgi:hypothetical protein
VEDREVIALLGLRLTPCQWSILHLLLELPLLSDEELSAFLSLQRKSARCSLYELHQLGCLEPIATVVGNRSHLCERGLRLVAAANHMHIRNISAISDNEAESETSTVVQRIKHTAGIYDFFASLAHAAKREPGQALCWWGTRVVCERRYLVGEQWYNLKPDALAENHVGSQRMRFWREWDHGTSHVRDLAVNFTSYAHSIASREWARERSMLPVLVCVAPDIAQASLTSPPRLVVWTTT